MAIDRNCPHCGVHIKDPQGDWMWARCWSCNKRLGQEPNDKLTDVWLAVLVEEVPSSRETWRMAYAAMQGRLRGGFIPSSEQIERVHAFCRRVPDEQSLGLLFGKLLESPKREAPHRGVPGWGVDQEGPLLELARRAMEHSSPWFLNTQPGTDDPGELGWDLWHNGGPGGEVARIPSNMPDIALWLEASVNALPDAIVEIRRLRGLLDGIAADLEEHAAREKRLAAGATTHEGRAMYEGRSEALRVYAKNLRERIAS